MPFRLHMWHTHLVSFCSCMQSRAKLRLLLPATIDSLSRWNGSSERASERRGSEWKAISNAENYFPSLPCQPQQRQKNCHQKLNYGSLNTCDLYRREIHIDETSSTFSLSFFLSWLKLSISWKIDCVWLFRAVIARRYF